MRILSLFLLLSLGLLLSSCLTMTEHYRFNSDGSGQFSTTIDLAQVLENPLFGRALAEQMGEDPEELKRIDTVFNMFERLLPANPQWTATERELMQRINSRMELDFETQEGGIYVNYDFSTVEELATMQALMKNANQPQEAGGLPSMGGDLGTTSSLFSWGKRKLQRETNIAADVQGKLGLEPAAMEMMTSMYADAKLIYIMELPGKIKKVTGFPGAQQTENSLRFEFPLLDMINSPASIDAALDGQVKFKRH